MDISKIKLLYDRVLIDVSLSEDKTKSGLVVSATEKKGVVVAVGPGVRGNVFKRIIRWFTNEKPPVQVGDTVVFSWSEEVTLFGKNFQITKMGDVLLTVKK